VFDDDLLDFDDDDRHLPLRLFRQPFHGVERVGEEGKVPLARSLPHGKR
jgi:hypothetical protein